jgi:transcriptional antiterminator NusG
MDHQRRIGADPPPGYPRELRVMDKRWFVLHCLSGQENKVRENILRRLQLEEMGEHVGDVLIPTERVQEVKQGKKKEITRKFFPGYVLINLSLYNADKTINERTWHFIQDTPGIIRFAGGERPVPLRQDEVDSIVLQVQAKQDKVAPKVAFDIGETIKINDGPFLNLNGTIDAVDPDRGKLKVSVSIFGRSTPVELEYWQVEKITAQPSA